MNNRYNSTQHLISLLNKGEIDVVISSLIQISNERPEDKSFKLFITHTSSRFNENKNDRYKGIISDEIYGIERNRISVAISDFIIENDALFKQDHIIQPPTYADFNPILDEIAYELAFNYFQVSFGETNKDINPKKIFSDKGNDFFQKNSEKKRNILIIGACRSRCLHQWCPLRLRPRHNWFGSFSPA